MGTRNEICLDGMPVFLEIERVVFLQGGFPRITVWRNALHI